MSQTLSEPYHPRGRLVLERRLVVPLQENEKQPYIEALLSWIPVNSLFLLVIEYLSKTKWVSLIYGSRMSVQPYPPQSQIMDNIHYDTLASAPFWLYHNRRWNDYNPSSPDPEEFREFLVEKKFVTNKSPWLRLRLRDFWPITKLNSRTDILTTSTANLMVPFAHFRHLNNPTKKDMIIERETVLNIIQDNPEAIALAMRMTHPKHYFQILIRGEQTSENCTIETLILAMYHSRKLDAIHHLFLDLLQHVDEQSHQIAYELSVLLRDQDNLQFDARINDYRIVISV